MYNIASKKLCADILEGKRLFVKAQINIEVSFSYTHIVKDSIANARLNTSCISVLRYHVDALRN